MANNTAFKWNGGTLTVHTQELPEKIYTSIAATVDFASSYADSRLKFRAPWHDITTNARNGLFSTPKHEGGPGSSRHSILLSHGVDYGIWLEVANKGKWQIIMPTLKAVGEDLMKGLDGILNHPGDPVIGIFKEQTQIRPLPYKKGTSQGATVRAERQGRRVKRGAKRTARGSARVTTRRSGRNR